MFFECLLSVFECLFHLRRRYIRAAKELQPKHSKQAQMEMDLDKNEVRRLILNNSTKISTLPIVSLSTYTKIFEAIHIDSQKSCFIRCKICRKLLLFKRGCWNTIIRHYNQHRDSCSGILIKRDSNKITPLQHSLHRLKKFLKTGGRPKIRKILQKRDVSTGTEYLIRWKHQKPEKLCWIPSSLYQKL